MNYEVINSTNSLIIEHMEKMIMGEEITPEEDAQIREIIRIRREARTNIK